MKDAVFSTFKKALPGIRKNVPLSMHTTFRIGGPARYFLKSGGRKEIIRALRLAKKLGVPVFVLGGGSNILASDSGFEGLVLKISNAGYPLKIRRGNVIEVPAGLPVNELVAFAVRNGLAGFEWAGGLPGTIGGAIRGNAGAFGGETKDSVLKVHALDSQLKLRVLTNRQAAFSYRNSIFKEKNWIVLSALLKFAKGDPRELRKTALANIKYRKDRHPLELPNAGSVFKNADLKLFASHVQVGIAHVVKNDPFPVVPVAYLLSESGLKGTIIGSAQVSPKHPNFIVNLGKATAKDVLEVIEFNKKNIKERYNIDLEQEIQFLS